MGRPLGSKNKQKCCTTLSHCLPTQVEAQDEEHLQREIQNVLAVIYGVDAESDSKNESEYDDSVLGKDFEMPRDQCESQEFVNVHERSRFTSFEPPVLYICYSK